VRKALRQAWELDDADKAERLIRSLARLAGAAGSRRRRQHPGGSRRNPDRHPPRPPAELRRSLACTNITENMMGTVRRVCRNVKRWQDASMALRWTSAAMLEAAKGFRRLKAHKQLSTLRTGAGFISPGQACRQ
jgi:putative transposase